MKKYYLAYGSNLNIRQMRYRCPGAKPIGITVITDYELLYKGSKTGAYLTIEPKKNSIVPIAVWEVTENDPCLLATAILDSFSLFYLPNNIMVYDALIII